MKTLHKYLLISLLLVALLLPFTAQASAFEEDKVIFGGTYTLISGETLDGDLVIFGGNATIEEDATVTGDVAVLGGRVLTNGTIQGNLVALGGYVEIESEAVILGDLTVLGSNIERADGAVIQGTMVTHTDLPTEITIPSIIQLSEGTFPHVRMWNTPFLSLSWFFFRAIIWAGLAILVTLFLKTQQERINETAFAQPAVSWVVGFLVVILLPVVMIALLITILLSPLSILAVLIALAASALGWVSLGLEVGRRLTKNMERKIDPALIAGLGTFILMVIFNGFRKLVPCIGFLPKALVGMWMLGAVALTLFGTQQYPRGMMTPSPPMEEEEIPDDLGETPGENAEGNEETKE